MSAELTADHPERTGDHPLVADRSQRTADHPRTERSAPLLGLAGDERLARLVGSGGERAFGVLYQRYHQPLYRYCRTLLRRDTDAQDALQSAFTAALVALREGRRDAPLRPWLFRIAHNESISLLRRRANGAEPLPEQVDALTTASAAEVAERRARLSALVADLRELPERQRGALVMRELSGLSHEEIALALGITVGAAKQTVFEARRSLLEFAEGRAMECEVVQRTVSTGDRRALRSRRVQAHLRDCTGCAVFATAIPRRQADLRALSPALPSAAAVGLLARVFGAGPGGSGGGSAGAVAGGGSGALGGSAAGVGGAAKTAALTLSVKGLAGGAALLATAAVGAGVALHPFSHGSPSGGATAKSGGTHSPLSPSPAGSAGSSLGSHPSPTGSAAKNANSRRSGVARHGAGQNGVQSSLSSSPSRHGRHGSGVGRTNGAGAGAAASSHRHGASGSNAGGLGGTASPGQGARVHGIGVARGHTGGTGTGRGSSGSGSHANSGARASHTKSATHTAAGRSATHTTAGKRATHVTGGKSQTVGAPARSGTGVSGLLGAPAKSGAKPSAA